MKSCVNEPQAAFLLQTYWNTSDNTQQLTADIDQQTLTGNITGLDISWSKDLHKL